MNYNDPYFLLKGAYSEPSLYNSPSPIDHMKYPCLVSYPFLSHFTQQQIIDSSGSIETDYDPINTAYSVKCPYCNYYKKN